MDPAILDLRNPDAHATSRPRGAVRLDLDDVLCRPYLLPARSRPLALIGGTPENIAPVLRSLRAAGHADLRHFPGETWRDHLPAETGARTRTHLWEPSRALVAALEEHGAFLPGTTALDLACGSGRNAVYL